MKADMKVSRQSKISLHFALRLNDGDEIDNNFTKEPAVFSFGDGSMLPAFENCLLGMEQGQEAEFLIAACDAFGEVNIDNIHQIQRRHFKDMDLSLGLMVNFDDAGKGEITGVVKQIDNDLVTVDFNHPLAGQDIIFQVRIVDIQDSDSLSVTHIE